MSLNVHAIYDTRIQVLSFMLYHENLQYYNLGYLELSALSPILVNEQCQLFKIREHSSLEKLCVHVSMCPWRPKNVHNWKIISGRSYDNQIIAPPALPLPLPLPKSFCTQSIRGYSMSRDYIHTSICKYMCTSINM